MGDATVEIPDEVQRVKIEPNRKANSPQGHRPIGVHEWPVLLRRLDRIHPGCKDRRGQ